jgi:hypothetical protein
MADTGWCNVSVCDGYEEALAEVERCLAPRPPGGRDGRTRRCDSAVERTGERTEHERNQHDQNELTAGV